MSINRFELLVFHRSLELDLACIRGGASAIIVDLENRGKAGRQQGFDTEINHHSPLDIEALKFFPDVKVICRVNGPSPHSREEIEQVIAAGADEILVPMIKSLADIEHSLAMVNGRCPLGILVETREALGIVQHLDNYPLSRVYAGLNDLRISRGSTSIFDAILDGTIESICTHLGRTPFGFAGLTLPGCGHPLPVHFLYEELARLGCSFTFLRRSFFHDSAGKDMAVEIPRILDAMSAALARPPGTTEQDRQNLQTVLSGIAATP